MEHFELEGIHRGIEFSSWPCKEHPNNPTTYLRALHHPGPRARKSRQHLCWCPHLWGSQGALELLLSLWQGWDGHSPPTQPHCVPDVPDEVAFVVGAGVAQGHGSPPHCAALLVAMGCAFVLLGLILLGTSMDEAWRSQQAVLPPLSLLWQKHGIPVPVTPQTPWSMDENLMHIR